MVSSRHAAEDVSKVVVVLTRSQGRCLDSATADYRKWKFVTKLKKYKILKRVHALSDILVNKAIS